MPVTVTALNRYPVKSLRGEPLDTAVVEPWGLAGDRRWMLAGDDDEAITAREVNRMLLLHPELTDTGVRIHAQHTVRDVEVPTGDPVGVTVHGRSALAVVADADTNAWFSDTLGRSARLVYMADTDSRPANPQYGHPDDRVSLADGYPVLITTEASLAALNDEILAGPNAAVGPLPMTRFRPNVVVTGTDPWIEDGWRRIRIGDAVFRSPKGCDRCVLTTIDSDTAERGKEPIATLARIRRFDGATWFGMNLIPDSVGTVRLGDELEVLDSVDAPDGPPR